jgi:hypothetical protein
MLYRLRREKQKVLCCPGRKNEGMKEGMKGSEGMRSNEGVRYVMFGALCFKKEKNVEK